MKSSATSVAAYLGSLPADRRAAVETVRKVILDNLDDAYEEGIQYGMLGYYVPHRIYPAGYAPDPKQPLPYLALASQKNHLAVYMMGLYCGCFGDDETAEMTWFRAAWAKTGKKLDMGKACLRFKRVEDLALDVLGEAVRRVPAKKYIKRYDAVAGAGRKKTPASASVAKKKKR